VGSERQRILLEHNESDAVVLPAFDELPDNGLRDLQPALPVAAWHDRRHRTGDVEREGNVDPFRWDDGVDLAGAGPRQGDGQQRDRGDPEQGEGARRPEPQRWRHRRDTGGGGDRHGGAASPERSREHRNPQRPSASK
jgi:hypothetical protein